ncbi:hypothetical protein PybrP1_007280 [[Pythium] brassicae (nom. inval.)]|nr:hypothetical protein PybrP1_007280 [[Pythium] brassicae (nom. inval.)]
MATLLRLRRLPAAALALTKQQTRSQSLLGAIFGIGEFEGARNQSLGASTSKRQAFELALLEYVGMNSYPKYMLRKALEDDDQFLMGHVLVGASQCLNPAVHQDSLDAVAKVSVVAAIVQANADTPLTEKLHVVALDAMVSGRYREAAVVYETILLQDPRDLLALRCSFDLYQILGDSKNILGTITRRLPLWSPNDAGFSHLLSMQAYGLQMEGRLDAAESIAEKALSMNGNDRWAFHTLLHVLEARGNANHGASYALQYREMFDNGGPLERHLYFQWALYLLDLGRYDRIFKFLEVNIFQQRVSEPHAALTVADATQLFWRLHFAGQDTEELREQLHAAWTALAADEQEQRVVFSPFTQLMCHSVLSSFDEAPSKIQRAPEAPVELQQLELKLSGAVPIQFSFGQSSADVAATFDGVRDGFTAYSQGRYEDATQRLLAVRGNVRVLGGTAVQHELVDMLLVESASRCEDLTLARLLMNERLSIRSQSAQVWSAYSRIFESIGDASALRDAQSMSYVLGLGQGGHQTN